MLFSTFEIFVDIKTNKTIKNLFVFFCFLFLFFLSGLRDNIGIDINSYERFYHDINNGSIPIINTSLEPFYSFLNKIAPSFKSLLFLCSFISLSSRYLAIRKMNIELPLTFLLFYYGSDFLFFDMGLIRQGIAMSICLLSIPSLVERKKRFFFYIFIGTMFHSSSIIFLALYLVNNREFRRVVYYFVIIASCMLMFSGEGLVVLFGKVVSFFNNDFLTHKFTKYIINYGKTAMFLSFSRRVVFGVFFVEVLKRKNVFEACEFSTRKKNEYTWLFINGYYLSIVFFAVFFPFMSSVAGRVTEVFYSLYVFVYISILSDGNKRINNILYFAVFVLLLLLTMHDTINDVNGPLIPYSFSI